MQAPTPAAPPRTFLIGHARQFFDGKVLFLERCAREYGDIVPLRLGQYRMYLVSEPAIVGEVLTTRAASFHKSVGLQRARPLIGNGLLTSEGAEHERRSRMAQPAFRHAEVERYAPAMVELTEMVAGGWHDGQRLDLSTEMSRLTLAIAARTLFGANLLAEATEIGAALTELLELLDRRLTRLWPLPLAIPTRENRRFNRARAVLDAAVFKMIRERRAAAGASAPAPDGPPDLLSRLLGAKDGGRGLDDAELRDEVMTLFLAGHETTANALTFTFFLLARYPEAAERLRVEALDVLGPDRPATAADLPRLSYAQQVFSEAIRLYPPAWMLNRHAIEDVSLGGGRLEVAKGEMVAVSPYVVQRDPRWFPDPLAFRPERFAPGAPRPVPWSYFPFGGGKRACIGRSFALIEAALILSTIVRRVDFEIDATREPELKPQITLRPAGGMPAVVRARRRPVV